MNGWREPVARIGEGKGQAIALPGLSRMMRQADATDLDARAAPVCELRVCDSLPSKPPSAIRRVLARGKAAHP